MSDRREISLGLMAFLLLFSMALSQCQMTSELHRLAKCDGGAK